MKLRVWKAEDTKVGRDLLQKAFEDRNLMYLHDFYDWAEANVIVEVPVLKETMDRVYQVNDMSRALKLYDAMMTGYDPIAQVTGKTIRISVVLVLLFGALGGTVYLFNLLFG